MDIHKKRLQISVEMKPLSCVRNIFLLLLLVIGKPLWADANLIAGAALPAEKEGMVKLVATLQDSPAFTDVVWKLYRLDLPGRPIMIINRHTAIVNLKPGKYRAVALLGAIVRSRSFNLESSEITEVILAMDK